MKVCCDIKGSHHIEYNEHRRGVAGIRSDQDEQEGGVDGTCAKIKKLMKGKRGNEDVQDSTATTTIRARRDRIRKSCMLDVLTDL